jgi:exodeoxyribonuclease VII large subunit
VQAKRRDAENVWKLAASLGPQAVLGRGYALVRDVSGGLVRLSSAVEAGSRLQVQFADAAIAVTADGALGPASKPPSRKPGPAGGQGTLF